MAMKSLILFVVLVDVEDHLAALGLLHTAAITVIDKRSAAVTPIAEVSNEAVAKIDLGGRRASPDPELGSGEGAVDWIQFRI
jgi:hypothetical protein